MASIAQAQEVYYLAHGEYADNISELDVEIPGNCSSIDNPREDGPVYKCANYFTLFTGSSQYGMINLNYCPDDTHTYEDCLANRTVHITFRLTAYKQNPSQAGRRICSSSTKYALGARVCSSLGM